MITRTAVDLFGYLCQRYGMACPAVKSTADLLAAVRGICAGADDPRGESCLGDLPGFLAARFPAGAGESWLDALDRHLAGMPLDEVCGLLAVAIDDWKQRHPQPHPAVPCRVQPVGTIDRATFEMVEDVFRRPEQHVPAASTLRELLAYEHAYLWCRWSCQNTTGYTPGLEDLHRYLCRRLGNPRGRQGALYQTLFAALGEMPFRDACRTVADLVRRWREAKLKRSGGAGRPRPADDGPAQTG